jgi:hypothetical protein
MKNIASLALTRERLVTLALLLAVAVAAPVVFKQQLIAGTIVNAVLIISTVLLGTKNGLIMGLVPSAVALGAGLLSPALAPMIPFIVVGNAILVLTFSYLSKVNYWLGIVAAAVLKFAFLGLTSTLVIKLLLNHDVAYTVASMMSWTQLVTAISGGIIAFGVLKLTGKPRWSSVT